MVGCDKNDPAEPVEDHRLQTPESDNAMTRSPTPVNPPGANRPGHEQAIADAKPEEVRAEAELKAADGQELEGEVKLYDNGKGVRLVAEIEDAKPGKHGFHIHEKGDCSDIQGKSMGGHFAPDKHQHALPGEADKRHLGDLGNVEIGEDGKGRMETTIEKANLKGKGAMSFLGKAVVVHMGEDSGKSKQPSGASGDPIACGVIEKT
jgi:Cu-Zn family superoxide dismutase